jgi:hypothetical protein
MMSSAACCRVMSCRPSGSAIGIFKGAGPRYSVPPSVFVELHPEVSASTAEWVVDETKECLNRYQGTTRRVPQDNWREHRPTSCCGNARLEELPCVRSSIFPQANMEMTMRKKILSLVVVPLMAAFTAQAAAASVHHHPRAKDRPVASMRFRNSNAYAAPDDIAVPSYWSNEANGAMASGPAGH